MVGGLSSGQTTPARRLNSFLHPSGKTVHVASNPEAAETLRRTLSKSYDPDTFDLYLKGSDEHIKAIQEAREHRENERERLRTQHTDIYTQFENVHSELDALSSELNSLTAQGVALDANFDRFGYSAHIRTVEDDAGSTSALSRASTTNSQNGDRPLGEALRMWKRPIIRQYFHKGLIWRASTDAEVSSMELFVDLLYVGIIAVIGDRAAEDPTGVSLLRFSITFILSWKLWTDLTTIISWVEVSDISQRLCILVYMAFLLGYATNIQNAFDTTYTELIAFYLGERLFTGSYFLLLAYFISMIRGPFIFYTALIVVACGFWIGSIHLDFPNQLALVWIGIAFDLFGNSMLMPLTRNIERFEGTLLDPIARHMQFYPALNIEHKTERMNAFVTLVIGYSVVALIYQSDAPSGINAYFGKAALGLIIAFCFSMIYFEVDSANLYIHAIRRHAFSFMIWQNFHLIFILAFTLASGALARLVVAHDCPDTPTGSLAEASAAKSVEQLDAGLRWFFCGGMGIALMCTAIISMAHDHRDLPGLRFRKRNRLALRLAASVVITTLPAAGDRLNSLALIAIVAGCVAFALLVELWGCSDCDRGSFWSDRTTCKYAAECKLRKADMEAFKRGEFNGIDELVGKRRLRETEKGEVADIA